MIDVRCPKCSAAFELDDDARGATAECGSCGVTFQIPAEGSVGVIIDEEKTFEVVCPECKTTHEVPDTVRGVDAECAVCGTVFRIPDVGIFGVRIEEEPSPSVATEGTDKGIPPPEPVKPAFDSKNKTRTLRISREQVAGNIMRPHLKEDEKSTPPESPRPGPGKPKAAAPRGKPVAPTPARKGSAAAPAPPKPPGNALSLPKPSPSLPEEAAAAPAPEPGEDDAVPAGRPAWTAAAALDEDEDVLACRELGRPGTAAPLILSLIPVILIPVAGALANMTLGIVLGGVGLVFWALSAFLVVSAGGKGGVILTNRRAVAVSGKNVASVTKDNES